MERSGPLLFAGLAGRAQHAGVFHRQVRVAAGETDAVAPRFPSRSAGRSRWNRRSPPSPSAERTRPSAPWTSMEILTTHVGADFDTFATMMVTRQFHPDARQFFPGSREGLRPANDRSAEPGKALHMSPERPVRHSREIYTDILHQDLLAIRGAQDLAYARALADYMHNLPHLIQSLEHTGLHDFYWRVERSSFLQQVTPPLRSCRRGRKAAPRTARGPRPARPRPRFRPSAAFGGSWRLRERWRRRFYRRSRIFQSIE
jgi:hypothetical protein